jgi:2-octaprenyl-6-methoxyphenol hydroxylase
LARDEVEILIVGGGHAGLFLGAALAGGWTVAVVDPEPPERIRDRTSDGRTLALLRGSEAIARILGVWPWVRRVASPIREVLVQDSMSAAGVRYEPPEDGRPFGWGLENRALRGVLLDAFVAAAGEGALLQGRVGALERGIDRQTVRLEDGRRLGARLVVGADGRGSRVRDLAGIGLERWSYGQTALTLVIRHELPHGDAVRELLRPAGPLALLPLAGRRSGVTWVERTESAARLMARDAPDLVAVLAEELGGVLGRVTADSPIAAHPLSAQHARRYVAPRIALVGDAAHGVHPIHAQGFNMGVADIGALAGLLLAARRRGADPGGADLLVAYERARWWANEAKLRLTDGLNRLFSTDFPPARLARAAALQALELVPPLKRLAVAQGMGGG